MSSSPFPENRSDDGLESRNADHRSVYNDPASLERGEDKQLEATHEKYVI